MRILLLSAILVLLLSGCSSIDLIDTREQAVERTELNLPEAEPLELNDPNWIVVTEDNVEEVFEYLKQEGYDPVIFGLTDRGYEKLSIDFMKIRQHINNQRNVLLRYKEYYEDNDPPQNTSE